MQSLKQTEKQAFIKQIEVEVERRKTNAIWSPVPGSPQVKALESIADITFYGGAAGSMKTDTLLGCTITQHNHGIIYRRQFPQLMGIRQRAEQLIGDPQIARFNAAKELWRFRDGRTLEFGACDKPDDVKKYQGRPHDFIGFDEICHFTEDQFRFLIGWNRPAKAADANHRCRVIAAGNPPTDAEGMWVIDYWGPWLDDNHPNPAKDGELRWYATIAGKDVERPDGEPFDYTDPVTKRTETIQPKSRTFIRGRVTDNPYLMAAGYMSTLQAMPEPLRSQMLDGNFSIGQKDDPHQVIPSSWIKLAMARWKPDGHENDQMDSLGVDVARGGRDQTILSPKHGRWFGHQLCYPGKDTPDGQEVATLCRNAIPAGQDPDVKVDIIGVGSSPFDMCRIAGMTAYAMNGKAKSYARDKTGKLKFVNKRAEWLWKLREALDPTVPADEAISLPPDRGLLADLSSYHWELRMNGIQAEAKEDIIKRIGRSPDKGDSIVYAHGKPSKPMAHFAVTQATPMIIFGR